jgi:hypothetical protein
MVIDQTKKMPAYPLYDRLLALAEKEKGKPVDVNFICNNINALERAPNNAAGAADHYYEIAALILHHESLTNKGLLLLVPYEGRTANGGRGIIYNIAALPPVLQHIIAIYLKNPQGL